MKFISRFSAVFLPFCLSLGLTISTAPARLEAQPSPYAVFKAKTLNEIEDAKRKIARNPDNVREHYRLGELYEKLTQWQDAVLSYSQALRIKPDLAHAHFDLGWCYSHLGNYEAALKAHQEAEKHIRIPSFKLKLPEKHVRYAIGWDLYKLRRYNEAIDHYVKAAQLTPAFQVAVYEVGRVYLAQGNQEGARQITDNLDPYLRDLLLKEIELIESDEKDGATGNPNPLVFNIDQETRPTILRKEKPQYTMMARDQNIQGIVSFSVIFGANGKITGVRIIRDLPYGLTAQALIAMQKVKFRPAIKDGQPVSVRSNLEFSFSLID